MSNKEMAKDITIAILQKSGSFSTANITASKQLLQYTQDILNTTLKTLDDYNTAFRKAH